MNWLRIAAICAVLTAIGGVVTISNPAGAVASGFYLDLGASVSLGLQPTMADPHGAPTNGGYADDLTEDQAAVGNDLRLVHLGCPGETTTTMISGGDRCYRAPDTQLAEAVEFLRGHTDEHGLITLDIGFDDVVACFAHHTLNSACVSTGIDLIAWQLPTIIDSLRDAAGPEVRMIGVGAYDPFVTDALKGPTDQAFAASSIEAIARVNTALLDAYNDAGVPMADVAGPFAGPVVGSTPDALAAMAERTCSLTWMCAAFPFGPNLHPNDEGYQLMADAISEQVGPLSQPVAGSPEPTRGDCRSFSTFAHEEEPAVQTFEVRAIGTVRSGRPRRRTTRGTPFRCASRSTPRCSMTTPPPGSLTSHISRSSSSSTASPRTRSVEELVTPGADGLAARRHPGSTCEGPTKPPRLDGLSPPSSRPGLHRGAGSRRHRGHSGARREALHVRFRPAW